MQQHFCVVWDCIINGSKDSMLIKHGEIMVGKVTIIVPSTWKPRKEKGGTIHLEMKEFAKAIFEGREPRSSGRDVRRTMVALEAAKLSLEQMRTVETENI